MFKRFAPILLLALCVLGVVSAPAFAIECAGVHSEPTGKCAPGWALTANTYPSTIAPGGHGTIVIDVMNVGAIGSSGPVTITDRLPPGVFAREDNTVRREDEESREFYQSFIPQAPSGAGELISHFQMGSCRALKFQPNFKVSTSGKTSRADGASLGVKVLYPTGELGANQASSQSNIEKVKVELPKRLPSRLTTLQKACPAAQFNVDPADCPADSVVRHATAVTPVLPVSLSGPAYFVSNGSEAFPNLIIVLQGYGVTVHLVGDTFINKAGITSSTFKQIPDVPIASFELTLPEGPFSALAANGNLCKGGSLLMPTEFVGQNGAEIHKDTKIEVQGCGKAKRSSKKKAPHHKAKHSKRRGKRG